MELHDVISKRNHLISKLTNDDYDYIDMLDEIFRLTDIIKRRMLMDVNDITKQIMMINNTDDLNHIKRMLKMRREDLARDLKYALIPGDRIKTDSNRIPSGTIVKVNRTKAVVRDERGQQWTVPLTMISTGE